MLCQVTVRVFKRGESHEVWFVLRTDQTSLKGIRDEIARTGVIYGQRIETRPFGEGRRQIVGECETIVGRDALVQISELQFDLLDQNGLIVTERDADGFGASSARAVR
jgi:hypothetical protein